MHFLNYLRNDRRYPEIRLSQWFYWFLQVPEAGVETSAFEQGNRALSEMPGAQAGAIETATDLQWQLKTQALEDLQRAWKSIRLMETLSDDPSEAKVAERALAFVDKAFAELEGDKSAIHDPR